MTNRRMSWFAGNINSGRLVRSILSVVSALMVLNGTRAAAATNILVIGSSRSFSDALYSSVPRNQKAFNPQLIVNQLQSILNGDAAITSANVVYQDIYDSDSTQLGSYTCQARNYSLLGYYSQPDDRAALWSNLRGEAGTNWDYVVILDDPSIIANVPGVYARGVKYIVDKVREGTAEPILMMQWPHAGSTVPTEDFGEVTYRVGDTGGIRVSPAGYAWDSLTPKDTGTHPTPNGAYLAAASLYSTMFNRNATASSYTYNDALADLAYATVQARANQTPYPGVYTNVTPHSILWKKDRAINGYRTGSSSESGFIDSYNYSGGRYYDALIESELLIKGDSGPTFHLGRGPSSGGGLYSQDPVAEGYFASIGFSFQILNSGPDVLSPTGTGHIDMLDGMDYITTYPFGDQRLAFYMIQSNQVARNVRNMPIFSLWAAASTELGLADPYADGRHYAADVNEIGVSYFMTLVTGRCPIGKNGTERERERQRIGYEAAWTMSTLSLRPPGFSTFPSSVGPKTLYMGDEEELTAYFVNAPQSPVTVNVSISPASAAIVSPSVLTFDGTNHDAIRKIKVTPIPGSSRSQNFDVVFTTSSDDICFNGLTDSWGYTVSRSVVEADESYSVINLPDRSVSVIEDSSIDLDLNVPGGDQYNTTTVSPYNGTLSWVGGKLRYQPNGGFLGEDGFSYYTILGNKLYKGHVRVQVVAAGSAVRVSVVASDNSAAESGGTGSWTITRSGDTSGDLEVAFELSGSATFTSDYTLSASSPVTIAAGSASVVVTLTPVNDATKEGDEIATLRLLEGEAYLLGVDLDHIQIADADNASPVVNAGVDESVVLSGQTLWTPGLFADGRMVAWYDAADASSYTVGFYGDITQFNDKSGYGNDLTGSGGLTGTRTLNGLGVSDFIGSGSLQNSGISRYERGDNVALYMVADLDDNSGTLFSFSYQFNSLPGFSWLGTGAVDPNGPSTFTSINLNHGTGPMMSGVVWDLGQSLVKGYVDGAQVASAARTAKFGANKVSIGYNSNMGFGEAIFTEDVSDETREKIEGYLAWKWGQSAELPATHPYKGFAPMVAVATLNLSGLATDSDDASLTSTWSLVDGPEHVTFANATSASTMATFYAAGTYRLRLSASDGFDVVSDEVVITVTDFGKPVVSVSADDAVASEEGPDAGSLRITRSGPTDNPLTVSFSLGGTATSGSDYNASAVSSITIPAGQSSALVTITPIDDTVYGERDETVSLTLSANAAYTINSLSADAELTITDNDNRAPVVDAGSNQAVSLVEEDLTPVAVAGADIFLNAGLDDGTNNVWEDSLARWSPTISAGVTFVADAGSSLPGITSAYAFPGGVGDAPGCKGLGLGDIGEDQQSISLELWFKPDASASYPLGGQVLWETGSNPGCGIFYKEGRVNVGVNAISAMMSTDVSDLTNEFIQVVVTFLKSGGANNWKLYINGRLKAMATNSDTDISNTNDAGLGTRNGTPAGGGGLSTDGLKGKIAIFRTYFRQVLSAAEVMTNYGSIAGAYATVDVNLQGVVTDQDGDPVTAAWTKVSGPRQVDLVDPSSPTTTASLGAHGTYVLRLTGTDGIETVHDEVTIVVGDTSTSTCNLTVATAHGTAVPSGLTMPMSNSVVNASIIDSPVLNGNTQYVCTGWVGTGSTTGGVGTNASFTITNDTSITWLWETNITTVYTVVFNEGANGSRTGGGALTQSVVEATSAVAPTITPDAGYTFDGWDSTAYTNVTGNMTINAQYSIINYTLVYLAGANGSISGTQTQTVSYGNSGSAVTAMPNGGYHFVDWSDSSTNNPRTDTGVTGNITVTANFAIDAPPVVDNAAGATSLTETSARVSGELTSGVVATAWVCWGLNDAGASSTGDWDHVVLIGSVSQGVPFSTNVTGLATNTTYFYRCYAANAYGTDWSDNAETFSGTPAEGTGGGPSAEDIVYVGFQTNVESKANTPTDGWRNVTPAKPMDVDGDNILGTDGYSIFQSGASVQSLPAYIGSVTRLTTSQNSSTGWGVMDHPATPSGTDTLACGMWFNTDSSADIVQFTISGSGLNGKTLRLGVLTGGYTAYGMKLRLTQIAGGSSTTSSVALAGSGVDCAFFDINNVADGDTFKLSGTDKTAGYIHASGLTFDSIASGAGGSIIANTGPTVISNTTAAMNASLNASGTDYDVYVYYGTSDGGTNAGSWTTSALVGSWTNVSTNVSYSASLIAGQAYCYTFVASNSTTVAWASPSWKFSTLPDTGGPTVTVNHEVPHTWLSGINPVWTNDYEAAVLADPDGDGFTTWQEYWSGTDPQSSNSYLKIDSIVFTGTNVIIEWQHAVVGAIPAIAIESSTNLATGPWVITGQKTPVDGTNSWSNTAAQSLFYRLAVTNAP